MFRARFLLMVVVLAVIVVPTVVALPPTAAVDRTDVSTAPLASDYDTYINANRILMFITNTGQLGRDLGGVFGHDYGTYFPFSRIDFIIDGSNISSPLYAFGLWMGGKVNDSVRMALAEYASEYVPGPMAGGTFQADRPEFRVYKLFKDSLENNPSADYLAWPTDQGAPLDSYGKPLCLGDQTLWAVYNDADPDQHHGSVDAGETAPLGIEVQQTVWALDQTGNDTISIYRPIEVTHLGQTGASVTVRVGDGSAVTGHSYKVVMTPASAGNMAWSLFDVDLGETVYSDQLGPADDSIAVEVVGLIVRIRRAGALLASFAVVANGAGEVDPPEAGAFPWYGFPTPTGVDPSGYPTDGQQVGDGLWGIHTGDNGGSCAGGSRFDYGTFLDRTLRITTGGSNASRVRAYDWEMRFTGSYSDTTVGGSYAIDYYRDNDVFWVPFELWRTGIGTPDDPSDDVRLIPLLLDSDNDNTYNLGNWGCLNDALYSGGGEHSVSGGDDDPYTDWLYWQLPVDTTPGEAGYQEAENAMLAGTFDSSLLGGEVFARTVLVNWNGGMTPPFTQDLPEQGTVFRITTAKDTLADSFAFTATAFPFGGSTGPVGTTVFIDYKLYNRGSNNISDFYLSVWADPDLGSSGDDLVGCDTLNDVFFCYNANEQDAKYAPMPPPACGFKILAGPVAPSLGDTAYFFGHKYADHANTHISSFNKYINGTDPDYSQEAYWFMQGLDAKHGGAPYVYNGDTLRFVLSGDPVTGTGDLDHSASDRRMMASFGPLEFPAGDSQQVVVAFAVGTGADRLASITELKHILNSLPSPPLVDEPTAVEDSPGDQLPAGFEVSQNYPNPFNPTTIIEYSLPTRCEVAVEVFNILGQRTSTVFRGEQQAGTQKVQWDGTDDNGHQAASGIYFYRVTAGENVTARKMILLR